MPPLCGYSMPRDINIFGKLLGIGVGLGVGKKMARQPGAISTALSSPTCI